jgi:hypothetical protein
VGRQRSGDLRQSEEVEWTARDRPQRRYGSDEIRNVKFGANRNVKFGANRNVKLGATRHVKLGTLWDNRSERAWENKSDDESARSAVRRRTSVAVSARRVRRVW